MSHRRAQHRGNVLFRALAFAAVNLTLSAPAAPANPDLPPTRHIPAPLAHHPGNIFLAHEQFSVTLPPDLPSDPLSWRALDDSERECAAGTLPRAAIRPPRLLIPNPGIGWYRIEFFDQPNHRLNWTTAAVLAPLPSPTPLDSPVSLDAAIAWFARDNPPKQQEFANLAALAGVNWIRDRLRWRDVQPAPDQFAGPVTYDSAAAAEYQAGLQVLQVFHDSPPWAGTTGDSRGRFTQDLRHLHHFAQAMARRFQGRVGAWEPWNEANVKTFGAHTVDEMCSWQKAAWLGFKTGDPNLVVGWNVTAAVPTPQHTHGILANEVTPYFDTYNIHTYDWAHDYDRLWVPARAATAGKPLWITEADRGMKHLNNPPHYDLPWPGARLKAEALVQEYAASLAAGATQHFHFILGQYQEPNGVQFGLLRRDLTPRPAYVALAAVGRLLAGARCLGQWHPGQHTTIVGFRSRPDGHDRDVLVLWAEAPVDWDERGRLTVPNPLPPDLPVQDVCDYLGRVRPEGLPARLGSAPHFVILPSGEARRLPLRPVPDRTVPTLAPAPEQSVPSVVLQILWPAAQRRKITDLPWSEGHVYTAQPNHSLPLQIALYNFGTQPVQGTIVVDSAPAGWSLEFDPASIRLLPGERQLIEAAFNATTTTPEPFSGSDGWLRIRGHFGPTNRPVVAFRCVLE